MSRLSKVRKLLPGNLDEKAHGLCRSTSAEDCIKQSRTRTGKALLLDGDTTGHMQTECNEMDTPGLSATTSESIRGIHPRHTVSSSNDKAWNLADFRILHQLQKPILIISYDRLGTSTALGSCS